MRLRNTIASATLLLVLVGCSTEPLVETTSERPEPTVVAETERATETEPTLEEPALSDPGTVNPEPEPTPETEVPTVMGSIAREDADEELAAFIAEYDQFMLDQQYLIDGSLFSAKTPEQTAFVEDYRNRAMSQGATLNPELEHTILTLAIDACGAAIMNNHSIVTEHVKIHIASSWVFEDLVSPELSGDARTARERSLASVMVRGMHFLCPDDYPQWKAAYDELYATQ